MVFETILTKHLKNAFFSGHALANVLAVTDAKLEKTSLSMLRTLKRREAVDSFAIDKRLLRIVRRRVFILNLMYWKNTQYPDAWQHNRTAFHGRL